MLTQTEVRDRIDSWIQDREARWSKQPINIAGWLRCMRNALALAKSEGGIFDDTEAITFIASLCVSCIEAIDNTEPAAIYAEIFLATEPRIPLASLMRQLYIYLTHIHCVWVDTPGNAYALDEVRRLAIACAHCIKEHGE